MLLEVSDKIIGCWSIIEERRHGQGTECSIAGPPHSSLLGARSTALHCTLSGVSNRIKISSQLDEISCNRWGDLKAQTSKRQRIRRKHINLWGVRDGERENVLTRKSSKKPTYITLSFGPQSLRRGFMRQGPAFHAARTRRGNRWGQLWNGT